MLLEQVHGHRRNQRPRKNVRREHGENHGFGQRHEQEFRHAGQEKHRHEHDADAQRRNQRGNGDFLRAVQNRLDRVLALRQISLDIFDGHRGVIHQDADGERQAAERHQIDGFVQRAQHRDGDQNRKRDRDGDDHRAAPAAQEQQNHQRGQAGGNHSFADHSLNGGAHENRLVEQGRDHRLRRQEVLDLRQLGVDLRHDVEGGRVAGLVNRQDHAALAVHARDIDLRRKAVADVGDVPHIDRRAVRWS